MTRELWLDAIFELADTWTHGVDAAEYACFLRRVLDRISWLEAAPSAAAARGQRATGLLTGRRLFWRNNVPRR